MIDLYFSEWINYSEIFDDFLLTFFDANKAFPTPIMAPSASWTPTCSAASSKFDWSSFCVTPDESTPVWTCVPYFSIDPFEPFPNIPLIPPKTPFNPWLLSNDAAPPSKSWRPYFSAAPSRPDYKPFTPPPDNSPFTPPYKIPPTSLRPSSSGPFNFGRPSFCAAPPRSWRPSFSAAPSRPDYRPFTPPPDSRPFAPPSKIPPTNERPSFYGPFKLGRSMSWANPDNADSPSCYAIPFTLFNKKFSAPSGLSFPPFLSLTKSVAFYLDLTMSVDSFLAMSKILYLYKILSTKEQ